MVNTIKFGNPQFVGIPIDTIKKYNDTDFNELILLDIGVTKSHMNPQYNLIKNIVEESNKSITYGGGINSIEKMRSLFYIGVKRISVNTFAIESPKFIRKASNEFGSDKIVASIDFWKDQDSNRIVRGSTTNLLDFAITMEKMGAGELLLTSVDRDGTKSGYDLEALKAVSETVKIPLMISGGVDNIKDNEEVKNSEASAFVISNGVVQREKDNGESPVQFSKQRKLF